MFSKFFRLNKRDKLFSFDLPRVEREFSSAITAVGFPLWFTPHVLRHSGPSCDRYEQRRSEQHRLCHNPRAASQPSGVAKSLE